MDIELGDTPADIAEKAVKLCRDFVGRHWTAVGENGVTIKRIR